LRKNSAQGEENQNQTTLSHAICQFCYSGRSSRSYLYCRHIEDKLENIFKFYVIVLYGFFAFCLAESQEISTNWKQRVRIPPNQKKPAMQRFSAQVCWELKKSEAQNVRSAGCLQYVFPIGKLG
jgi:hypothetical protein